MIAVKVLNCGEVREAGAKKTKIQKITVQNLSTQETMVVDVFLGKKGMFDFGEHDQITMPIEGKEYKGKTQYSAPGWKCVLLDKAPEVKEEPKPEPVPTKYSAVSPKEAVPQEVWETKQKREQRSFSINQAIEIAKIKHGTQVLSEAKADGGLLSEIVSDAEELMDYKWNGIVENQPPVEPTDEELFPCE